MEYFIFVHCIFFSLNFRKQYKYRYLHPEKILFQKCSFVISSILQGQCWVYNGSSKLCLIVLFMIRCF
jgi:hypothetical protein